MTQSTATLRTDGQSSPRAMCPTCKEVFSNGRNFDAHMLPLAKRTKGRVCIDPAEAGLVLSEKYGHWITDQEWKKEF